MILPQAQIKLSQDNRNLQVRQFDAQRLLVIASPKVVARITDEESAAVAELEEFLGKSIRFQAEDQYAQEQFDVVLL